MVKRPSSILSVPCSHFIGSPIYSDVATSTDAEIHNPNEILANSLKTILAESTSLKENWDLTESAAPSSKVAMLNCVPVLV